MADASHELRTPLSVMRTATDVTLEREGRTEGEYRDALKIIDEQVRRLTRIVEDMFMLARADVGRQGIRASDFYLDELIMEAARAADVLASRKRVSIVVAHVAETPFHGDEGLLRQMLLNLLDNAVKHTPAGGSIHVRLVRAEAVRGGNSGAGLGLSIARWIAEAHGGRLVLQQSGEAGSTFVASLPANGHF